MKDITVTLEERPGTLATMAEALGNAGVNIDGACSISTGTEALVHILVEDAADARRALEGAGLTVQGEHDAIVVYVSGEDRPGILGRYARKIADAGANIQLAYFATGSRLVFVTTDNAKVRAALRE